MTYSQQSFQAGAVLQASQMNQAEINVRDHQHGRSGVLSIFDPLFTNSDATLTGLDAGKAIFLSVTKTVTIAPSSITNGWYAAVFNVGSLTADLVTITPGSGSLIDRMPSIQLGPQQGCLVLANSAQTGINFSTIGRPPSMIPQNAQNANYTLALTDAGKHLYHDIASAHLYTIPANSGTGSVQFPIGTAITFVNANSAGNAFVISSDTLRKVGSTDVGTRTLAANGMATAMKVSSATWYINGTGLT